MRLRFLHLLMILALTAFGAVAAHAQSGDTPQDPNDDETARGTFLSSRPPAAAAGASLSGGSSGSSSGSTGSANLSTAGKSTGGKATTGGSTSGRSSTGRTSTRRSTGRSSANTGGTGGSTSGTVVKSYANQPIGLGYSIYMKDPVSGNAMRVDPNRAFHAGDAIRIAMESNVEGYLYIFHTENDGAPEMLFPSDRLSNGKNFLSAHVPHEIPSGQEALETNRWFIFDSNPAVERLYIVISRAPLPTIPTGTQLVNICKKDKTACPLHMSAMDWAEVKANMDAKVVVSRQKVYGQVQTNTESDSAARGLGLAQDAPEPTVIRMSAISTAKALVTTIDLNHQ